MKKEETKPSDEPINYSAFKGEYVRIISGGDKVEYSAKVINLYNGKLTLNLADGNERILSLAYIHSINRIDKPIDFKLATRIGTKKRKTNKKKEAWMKAGEKDKENNEKDEDDESLEGIVQKDE